MGMAVVGGGGGGDGRLVGDVGENSTLFPNSTLFLNSDLSDLRLALTDVKISNRHVMF